MDFEKIHVVMLKTKRFEDDDVVETELTLDYSNCTIEDLLAKAIKSDKISWQASFRNKKADNISIPTKATYVVPKVGTRAVKQVEATPEAIIAKFGSVDAAIQALEALRK
jgi:hypothetical protein